MKSLLLLITIFLSGCASNYTSIDQVRQSQPQKTVSVALPLETSYENVLIQVSECFTANVYKVVSFKRDKSAEVSILAAAATTGSNVWLSLKFDEVSPTETKVSLFWGNSNWESHAEKAIKWASGDKTKC